MSEPPSHEHGPRNVVDSEIFASRLRARSADVGEDAALELRLFDAERRLAEVATERDALRERLADQERALIAARQREWAEQQQRLEAQGEVAAVRDGVAVEVAALRHRLAAAEAEVATLAHERDAARRALASEARRRAEVERRAGLVAEASAAVGAARRELAGELAAARRLRELEARIAVERDAFAVQVGAVERAVTSVRERLGAGLRALQERLVTERAAREVAESALEAEREAGRRARMQVAWLDAELARRGREESELRTALEGLREELEQVRSGDASREAALTARVESVVAMASRLREGLDDGERERLGSALAAMHERVEALQRGVAEAAAVREQLESERAARWVAEQELDAERRRGAGDRAARAAAEERLASAEAELEELRADLSPTSTDPGTIASLREAIEGLRAASPALTDSAVGFDLAAAAQRLRATAEPLPVEDGAEAEAAAPAEAPASVEAPAAAEPPAPAPVIAADRAAASRLRLVPVPSRPPAPAGPWLRDALVAMAGDQPELAEQLLVALLPAQRGLVRKPVVYGLEIAGGTTYRVHVAADRAGVEPAGWPAPAVRLTGPLAALVPLATGGAARRLPGVEIDGRRHIRRLLKRRRAPIGLADLAESGVTLPPGLLLAALARAVDPEWTAGAPLTVDVVASGADTWRVVATGDGPLKVLPAVATVAPPRATMHTSAARLPAVLAGPAKAGEAAVEGDVKCARTLLSWFDRAQRAGR